MNGGTAGDNQGNIWRKGSERETNHIRQRKLFGTNCWRIRVEETTRECEKEYGDI